MPDLKDYSLHLTNGKAEWKSCEEGVRILKAFKELPQRLSGEPLLTEKLSCGKVRQSFPRTEMSDRCVCLLIWNSMPRIYSLIHLVALNKIICAKYQEGMCFLYAVTLLAKTHPTPGLRFLNLICVFSQCLHESPKQPFLTYLFSFKLWTDQLLWLHGQPLWACLRRVRTV